MWKLWRHISIIRPVHGMPEDNLMRKNRFFKIRFPDGKSMAVESKNGYAGLIDLAESIKDKENTYIVPISWFEFVLHIIFRGSHYD